MDRDPEDEEENNNYYKSLEKNEEIERNQGLFLEFVKLTGKVKDIF